MKKLNNKLFEIFDFMYRDMDFNDKNKSVANKLIIKTNYSWWNEYGEIDDLIREPLYVILSNITQDIKNELRNKQPIVCKSSKSLGVLQAPIKL